MGPKYVFLVLVLALAGLGFSYNIEVHVNATASDGSLMSSGISDGDLGSDDITVFGPSSSDFSGGFAYDFDVNGNPSDFSIPVEITPLSSPTVLSLGDDSVSSEIALPFNANMFGNAVNTVRVSSNGYLLLGYDDVFSTDSGCCSGESMSSQDVTEGTDSLVAGVWNDLYPPGTADSITYGTEGSAPNRVFIVSYNNISNCCNSGGGYTFQIKLFENGTEGQIPEPQPFCCSYPLEIYDSFGECDVSCSSSCNACDASDFGFNCAGYFGYGYSCLVDNDDDGPDQDDLDADIVSSCEESLVLVTDNGNPVSGADVTVVDEDSGDPIASGETDSDGEFEFPGCPDNSGLHVEATASKSGYSDELRREYLADCSQCAAPVCQPDEQLVNNECVPIPCECGQVVNGQCVPYTCDSGQSCAACPTGLVCQDKQCKAPEPEGCTSDLQCDTDQVCRNVDGTPGTGGDPGSCVDLCPDGSNFCQCSNAVDHALVPTGYECGTEAGCPVCPQGEQCVDHKCIGADLSCPSTGVVGDQKTCDATDCPNCDYEVILPNGQTATGKTDENGDFNLPLNLEGTYKVTLFQNGQPVKTVEIKAFPQAPPEEPEKPPATGTEGGFPWWVLIIVLLLVIGFLWWRSQQKKK